MNIKEIVVTPAMAKALLLKNTNNRTLREHQTRYLARELERDAWITNLDPIAVSTEGVLLNGQHRLSAIVRANKAAKVLFTDDADPSVFPVTDRGLGRTVADATGLTNGLVADAVLIAYFLTGDRARIPVDKIQDIVEWWKPTHDALQEAAHSPKCPLPLQRIGSAWVRAAMGCGGGASQPQVCFGSVWRDDPGGAGSVE